MFEPNQHSRAIHAAWDVISRARSCPPADMLLENTALIRAHLERCEHCRDKLAHMELLSSMAKPRRVLNKGVARPMPGQICQIAMPCSCLDEEAGIFANPPLMVILEDAGKEHILAAQLHDAPELALPGDFALSGENGGFFVESWNVFPLLKKFVGAKLGEITPDELKGIKRMRSRDLYPAQPSSPQASFRALEASIASEFCAESVETLYHSLSSENLLSKLKNKIIDAPWFGLPKVAKAADYALAAGSGVVEYQDRATGVKIVVQGSKARITSPKARIKIYFLDAADTPVPVKGGDCNSVLVNPGEEKTVILEREPVEFAIERL